MLIDETKYNWSRTNPIEILAEDNSSNIEFEKALRIYRIEGAAELSIYEDNTKENLLYEGFLPFEPETTIACTSLYMEFVAEEEIPAIVLIAERGDEKTALLPYLNTTEGMSYINNGYNDDSSFSTAGLDSFLFNGVAASTVYVSSNHWFGFGANSEQLKIMRRDGCSTALYRQQGVCSNGLEFLKIRLTDTSKCTMLYLKDDDIKLAFATMINKLIYCHKLVLKPYLESLQANTSDKALLRIQQLETLLEQNAEQRETLHKLMAQGYIDQILFTQENNALLTQANDFRSDIEALNRSVTGDTSKVYETERLIHFCECGEMLLEYSEDLFELFVDHIEVYSRQSIGFVLHCGLTFKERI